MQCIHGTRRCTQGAERPRTIIHLRGRQVEYEKSTPWTLDKAYACSGVDRSILFVASAATATTALPTASSSPAIQNPDLWKLLSENMRRRDAAAIGKGRTVSKMVCTCCPWWCCGVASENLLLCKYCSTDIEIVMDIEDRWTRTRTGKWCSLVMRLGQECTKRLALIQGVHDQDKDLASNYLSSEIDARTRGDRTYRGVDGFDTPPGNDEAAVARSRSNMTSLPSWMFAKHTMARLSEACGMSPSFLRSSNGK